MIKTLIASILILFLSTTNLGADMPTIEVYNDKWEVTETIVLTCDALDKIKNRIDEVLGAANNIAEKCGDSKANGDCVAENLVFTYLSLLSIKAHDRFNIPPGECGEA